MNLRKRPDRKSLKPINLFDAELHRIDGDEVISSVEPRYLPVYPHMTKEEAQKLHDFLGEQLKSARGTIIYCVMGRMVG